MECHTLQINALLVWLKGGSMLNKRDTYHNPEILLKEMLNKYWHIKVAYLKQSHFYISPLIYFCLRSFGNFSIAYLSIVLGIFLYLSAR